MHSQLIYFIFVGFNNQRKWFLPIKSTWQKPLAFGFSEITVIKIDFIDKKSNGSYYILKHMEVRPNVLLNTDFLQSL